MSVSPSSRQLAAAKDPHGARRCANKPMWAATRREEYEKKTHERSQRNIIKAHNKQSREHAAPDEERDRSPRSPRTRPASRWRHAPY